MYKGVPVVTWELTQVPGWPSESARGALCGHLAGPSAASLGSKFYLVRLPGWLPGGTLRARRVRARARACVRACARACVRAWVCRGWRLLPRSVPRRSGARVAAGATVTVAHPWPSAQALVAALRRCDKGRDGLGGASDGAAVVAVAGLSE